MLIVGYCFGIRSERRLCEEVQLNLAYRWFCGLGLDGEVPDYSTFSKNRHGRFRDSDLLRRLFETVLQRCIDEGLVGGQGFAVDASLIQADASDRTRVEGTAGLAPDAAGRAVDEYQPGQAPATPYFFNGIAPNPPFVVGGDIGRLIERGRSLACSACLGFDRAIAARSCRRGDRMMPGPPLTRRLVLAGTPVGHW